MEARNDFDIDLEGGLEDEVSSLKDEGGRPRFLGLGMRTPTVLSNSSKRSFSTRPIQLIKRLTNSSQVVPEQAQPRISDGRELILFLGENQPRTVSFKNACDWYVTFLDCKCKTFWHLIQPVVVGVKERTPAPDAEDLDKVDHVLMTIARVLSKKKEFALVDIVDDLMNDGLIRDTTDDRVPSLQLLFTFMGWLTMFYDARANPKPKTFQIAKSATSSSGNRVDLKSRTFDTYSQTFEYFDHTLSLLLGRFGKLIPDPPPRRNFPLPPPTEYIIAAFVCYQTLRKVCQIDIEWVDALGLHLEFDSSRRVLKLFRFPSFCKLMYRHRARGLLSQLFDDNERSITGESRADNELTSSFFCEMLLTYRLIFSQDSASHSLFASEMHLASKSRKPSLLALPDADPLLLLLCGRSADFPPVAALYESLRADNPQADYMPAAFPWFASRLLAVQGYVKQQHPHDWKTLWHDHRDKTNWWQFWAVLFIGGSTIILSVLSLTFQIWQAVLTQQQVVQGQQNSQPAPTPVSDI